MQAAPSVIVSSTFHDLRQIRADLRSFIEDELGYTALLSEYPSFPVDPDHDAIENCRARVEQNCDLFLLVIGGRYGSIDTRSDKSVTNIEFLAAATRGVPIYVFVDKQILTLLPLWKGNPYADYSPAVDTTRPFEFVSSIREQRKIWTFPFETAQDIKEVLRCQFAYLFGDALEIRSRFLSSRLSPELLSLSLSALRIALEGAGYWEYRLFLQSWADEVNSRKHLLTEHREQLRLETAEFVSAQDASNWILTRFHELSGWVEAANKLMNETTREAFGPPGEPGDANQIVWVSFKLGQILENVLRWSRKIRCARVCEPFDKVAQEVSKLADDLVNQFSTFPVDSLRRLESAIASHDEGKRQVVDLSMTLQLSNLEAFNSAMEEAKHHYGII